MPGQDDIFRALDMLMNAGTKIVTSQNAKATAISAENLAATLKREEWDRAERLLEEKRQYDQAVGETQNLIRDVDYREKENYKLGLSQEYQDALPKEFKTVEFESTIGAITDANQEKLQGSFAKIEDNMTSMQRNKAEAYNNAIRMKALNRLSNEYQQGAEMYDRVGTMAGISGLRDLKDVETFIESQSETESTKLTSAQIKGLRVKDSVHWKNNITTVTSDDRVTYIDQTSGNKGEVLITDSSKIELGLNEAVRHAESPNLYQSIEALTYMLGNSEIIKQDGIENVVEGGYKSILDSYANPGRAKGHYNEQEIQDIDGTFQLAIQTFVDGLGSTDIDGVDLTDMTVSQMYNTFYDKEKLFLKGTGINPYGLKDATADKIDWNQYNIVSFKYGEPWSYKGDTPSQKLMFKELLEGWGITQKMQGKGIATKIDTKTETLPTGKDLRTRYDRQNPTDTLDIDYSPIFEDFKNRKWDITIDPIPK